MLPVFLGLGVASVSVLDVPQRWTPLVLLAIFAGWAVSALVLVGGSMWWISRQRRQRLDEAFAPLGLEPVPVGMVTRGYQGAVAGRPVHGWFSKGPGMEIYVEAQSGMRIGMGRSTAISQGLGAMMSKTPRPVGEGIQVWSEHGEWVDQWLEAPGVRARIIALCTDLPGARQMLIVAPDSVKLHLRYFMMQERTGKSDITTERLDLWLSHLVFLAESLERRPAGAQAASSLEVELRMDRRKLARRVRAWSIGVTLLVAVFVAGAILAGVWLG